MEKKKLTFTIEASLMKEFKILAINLDVTMSSLVEDFIQGIVKKYRRKLKPAFTTFGKYGIQVEPTEDITQAEREDTVTIDEVQSIDMEGV